MTAYCLLPTAYCLLPTANARYNPRMAKNTPPRVLVAEDNPQGAELLEAYLSETPYEVRVASDGEATLKLVRDWQPDLLLLDVMMPKLSGFEVCKRFARRCRHARHRRHHGHGPRRARRRGAGR